MIKKQQIVDNKKCKMDILVKVILITVLSSLLTLLLFDYSGTQVQLDMNMPVNCLTINQQSPVTYLCSSCFKLSSENKYKEKVTFQSKNKFLILGFKDKIGQGLQCRQWLHTIDYQSQISRLSAQRNLLKLQPFVLKSLNLVKNQHNQILQIVHSQTVESIIPNEFYKQQANSSLQYNNYVAFYYTSTRGPSQIKAFYSNQNNKQIASHILKILSIASFLAILYVFHCSSKIRASQNYIQNIVSVVGIVGLNIWIVAGDIEQQSIWVSMFCKVIFFSLAFGVVFGVGKWLFFGIIILSYFLLAQLANGNPFYQITFECILMVILVLKINSLSKSQYFFVTEHANKKIYFVIMSLIIVMVSCLPYIVNSKVIKQIAQFQINFIIIVTFLISVKNMDDTDYQKLYKQQKIISPTLDYNNNRTNSGSSTSMVEENQLSDRKSPNRFKK